MNSKVLLAFQTNPSASTAQVHDSQPRRLRHVIVPEIRGGATVMDGVFDDDEGDTHEGDEEAETS